VEGKGQRAKGIGEKKERRWTENGKTKTVYGLRWKVEGKGGQKKQKIAYTKL